MYLTDVFLRLKSQDYRHCAVIVTRFFYNITFLYRHLYFSEVFFFWLFQATSSVRGSYKFLNSDELVVSGLPRAIWLCAV